MQLLEQQAALLLQLLVLQLLVPQLLILQLLIIQLLILQLLVLQLLILQLLIFPQNNDVTVHVSDYKSFPYQHVDFPSNYRVNECTCSAEPSP